MEHVFLMTRLTCKDNCCLQGNVTIAAPTVTATEPNGQQLSYTNVQDSRYFHISAFRRQPAGPKSFLVKWRVEKRHFLAYRDAIFVFRKKLHSAPRWKVVETGTWCPSFCLVLPQLFLSSDWKIAMMNKPAGWVSNRTNTNKECHSRIVR